MTTVLIASYTLKILASDLPNRQFSFVFVSLYITQHNFVGDIYTDHTLRIKPVSFYTYREVNWSMLFQLFFDE